MNELAHQATVSHGDMTPVCNRILVSAVLTFYKISNPTAVSRTSQSVAGSSSVHMFSASCIIASMALMRLDPLTAVSTIKTYTRVRACSCGHHNTSQNKTRSFRKIEFHPF